MDKDERAEFDRDLELKLPDEMTAAELAREERRRIARGMDAIRGTRAGVESMRIGR